MEDQAVPFRSLRIALVSTCALSTPPKAYGGTELVVAELARELRELGHQPTVFATGDSTCVGARAPLFAQPVWPPEDLAELRHAAAAYSEIRAGEFDLVHVNHAEALAFTRLVPLPTVATIHHERDARLIDHYASYPDVAFVAISHRQAELAWEIPIRAVVHHGLDVDAYPAGPGGERCAFLGRFAPSKGTEVAIDVARSAGVPIALGGDAHPPERAYFEREILPRLAVGVGSRVDWLGEVDLPRKLDLLRHARCLLVPIRWEEPFGLVMIEAMLVGTPVIAFACGAAPEIVEDGVTGYLVHTPEEMALRLREIGRIDRAACRARARERWSAARMARGYAALYRTLVDRAALSLSPSSQRPSVTRGARAPLSVRAPHSTRGTTNGVASYVERPG